MTTPADGPITAVRTTGIFCREGCPAKPLPHNTMRFATTREALFAGYRPCMRCRPMEPMPGAGAAEAAPGWLRPLLTDVEARLKTDPDQRWRDRDLRSRDLDPMAVRTWFQRKHGLTFQAYARARRLSVTLGRGGMVRGSTRVRAARGAGTGSENGQARPLVTTRFETPLGTMVAAAVDEGVAILEFTDRRMLPRELDQVCRRLNATPKRGRHRHINTLRAQLDEYFAGNRTAFDVPLTLTGTPFEEASWTYLQSIPPGETRTYAQGARALGRPAAVRAFARANGANRLAIVIPCHRVIGSDGSLTGYGGGLWRKQALLDLETGHRPGSNATVAEPAPE